MTHPLSPGSLRRPEASVDSPADADRVVELLTQQRDLYQQLTDLSGRQQAVVAEGQTESLLTVLSERQVVVDRLTQINGELAPLRSRMAAITESASEATREAIRSRVAEVQDMLQAIIERDEQDRQSLEESKAQVGRELAKVRTAPAAIHAYKTSPPAAAGRAYAPTAARFTDARG